MRGNAAQGDGETAKPEIELTAKTPRTPKKTKKAENHGLNLSSLVFLGVLAVNSSFLEASMQLGFVSAILGDQSLEQVLAFARDEGFACVELMCWPPGRRDRRYAGVRHLDVTNFTRSRRPVQELIAQVWRGHIRPRLLSQSARSGRRTSPRRRGASEAGDRRGAALGVTVVNTFIGRDPTQSLEAQLAAGAKVWPELVRHAEAPASTSASRTVRCCSRKDEWPGGKNLAVSPACGGSCSRRCPVRIWD